MTCKIHPHIYGRRIGTIYYDEGKVYFQYDDAFRNSALEISPFKLPLDLKGVYTNRDGRCFAGLPGVFHDSLPDRFGTKVLERYFESRGIPSYELNVAQKLMFIGGGGMGAITYEPAEEMDTETGTGEPIAIRDFAEIAGRIMAGEPAESMPRFIKSAASAGGANPKAVIGYAPDTREMIDGTSGVLPEGFEHWLIKFDTDNPAGKDRTKLEYLYMSMAKDAGIITPELRLYSVEGVNHFLIRRFDRIGNEPIHLHSVAGLTHTDFNLPYHFSYDLLLRLTMHLTGSQRDVEEQYRRMVFNVVGRNRDDHAKNFSFLMDKSGNWSVSPAYDITYADTGKHQLSIRGENEHIGLEDLLDIARENSIKRSRAKEMIERTVEILAGFERRAREIRLREDFIERVRGDLKLDILKR